MTINLRDKKYRLIEYIMAIEDKQTLDKVENAINKASDQNFKKQNELESAVRSIRTQVTLADIDQEQPYEPLNYAAFKQLADQIGIEGDIDELLADIAD
ncbi:hypothetical protein [Phaeodactylibacter xiamenensis]|uniref:hypothetical protein n=1 Tax=Phaeodactylibacter xiamenensis TaxID=1524460 RepID=UPI003CCC2EE6